MLWALPGAETFADRMRAHWRCDPGGLNLHRFPDGECCPVFDQQVAGRDVVLTAVLDHPDASLFALYLCARLTTAAWLLTRSIPCWPNACGTTP
jgi:ribose-phosphate pyrophosphokinase